MSRRRRRIEASASPRKPRVATCSEVIQPEAIFEVACRVSASASCSAAMPQPSSATRINPDAAFFKLHLDCSGAGVDGVFEQPEHRGRAFDHFAGGNLALIREVGRRAMAGTADYTK